MSKVLFLDGYVEGIDVGLIGAMCDLATIDTAVTVRNSVCLCEITDDVDLGLKDRKLFVLTDSYEGEYKNAWDTLNNSYNFAKNGVGGLSYDDLDSISLSMDVHEAIIGKTEYELINTGVDILEATAGEFAGKKFVLTCVACAYCLQSSMVCLENACSDGKTDAETDFAIPPRVEGGNIVNLVNRIEYENSAVLCSTDGANAIVFILAFGGVENADDLCGCTDSVVTMDGVERSAYELFDFIIAGNAVKVSGYDFKFVYDTMYVGKNLGEAIIVPF